MIRIENKADCCGCESCVQICPKKRISFKQDHEGFNYPNINIQNCIKCGLCVKVCPVINQDTKRDPIKVYTAKNYDEKIRMGSSYGGIFTLLAENIIADGGSVLA